MTNYSLITDEALCDYWETPVINSTELWVERQLFTTFNTYFFFHKNHDSPANEYYVLTIQSDEPFKITEEGLGWRVVGHLLEKDVPTINKETKKGRTFKVWNTQFAKDSFSGLIVSKEEHQKMEKFQYIIKTDDYWIEFVVFKEPKWELHQNKKLDDLVIEYLRKDSLD